MCRTSQSWFLVSFAHSLLFGSAHDVDGPAYGARLLARFFHQSAASVPQYGRGWLRLLQRSTLGGGTAAQSMPVPSRLRQPLRFTKRGGFSLLPSVGDDGSPTQLGGWPKGASLGRKR
jgi:hypothetical protein